MPKKQTQRKLARPGDPLVLGDGSIVPEHKGVPAEALVQRAYEELNPAKFRPTRKRDAKDLPAPISVMKGIGVVFAFTMMGMTDREMASILDISMELLDELRNHSAYKELFDTIHTEFVNANSELLASRIAAYSHSALDTVAKMAGSAKHEPTRFKAADSIIDRALGGAEARGQKDKGTLRIVVLDDERDVNINIKL